MLDKVREFLDKHDNHLASIGDENTPIAEKINQQHGYLKHELHHGDFDWGKYSSYESKEKIGKVLDHLKEDAYERAVNSYGEVHKTPNELSNDMGVKINHGNSFSKEMVPNDINHFPRLSREEKFKNTLAQFDKRQEEKEKTATAQKFKEMYSDRAASNERVKEQYGLTNNQGDFLQRRKHQPKEKIEGGNIVDAANRFKMKKSATKKDVDKLLELLVNEVDKLPSKNPLYKSYKHMEPKLKKSRTYEVLDYITRTLIAKEVKDYYYFHKRYK